MIALKMSPTLMLLKYRQFPYQLPNKEYLITLFKINPFFVCSLIKENVDLVNDLVLSQEDTPQTDRKVREHLIISRVVMKLPP